MNELKPRQRIIVVTAVPLTVTAFLLPYLRKLTVEFEVTVACSGSDLDFQSRLPDGVKYIRLNIARNIDPVSDLIGLVRMIGIFRRGNYDLAYSVTPKAGLLTQLAAKILGIPLRVHMFTGQVWVTRKGVMRSILKSFDRLIAACATHLLTDSHSQLKFLVSNYVVPADKIRVLGNGSICGVDLARFHPDAEMRKSIRRQLGYNDQIVLALFVGRLNRAKGIMDLVHAFGGIYSRAPNLHLLIIGPDEEQLASEIIRVSSSNPNIRVHGPTVSPEQFMAAADFFCLPSYREGFGSVVIEAAACGIPSIASRIYGLTDAVEEGKSGILHEPGNIAEIEDAIVLMANDKRIRSEMGANALSRAERLFSQDAIIDEQLNFIRQTLVDMDNA